MVASTIPGDDVYSRGNSVLMCPKRRAGASVAESRAKALYVMALYGRREVNKGDVCSA